MKGDDGMYKYFVADEYVKSIFDIDLASLKEKGKRVIFTDLDNTLVGPAVLKPSEEVKTFFNQARALGYEIHIVSNNNQERVVNFATDLCENAHHRAYKPFPVKMRRILKQYRKEDVMMIGDQLMTDVLCAKQLGLYTILVEPIHLATDESTTRFNRKIERHVVGQLKKRNLPIPLYLDK